MRFYAPGGLILRGNGFFFAPRLVSVAAGDKEAPTLKTGERYDPGAANPSATGQLQDRSGARRSG